MSKKEIILTKIEKTEHRENFASNSSNSFNCVQKNLSQGQLYRNNDWNVRIDTNHSLTEKKALQNLGLHQNQKNRFQKENFQNSTSNQEKQNKIPSMSQSQHLLSENFNQENQESASFDFNESTQTTFPLKRFAHSQPLFQTAQEKSSFQETEEDESSQIPNLSQTQTKNPQPPKSRFKVINLSQSNPAMQLQSKQKTLTTSQNIPPQLIQTINPQPTQEINQAVGAFFQPPLQIQPNQIFFPLPQQIPNFFSFQPNGLSQTCQFQTIFTPNQVFYPLSQQIPNFFSFQPNGLTQTFQTQPLAFPTSFCISLQPNQAQVIPSTHLNLQAHNQTVQPNQENHPSINIPTAQASNLINSSSFSIKNISSKLFPGQLAINVQKNNQDNLIVKNEKDGSCTLGVFDGHGEHGHLVSEKIKNHLNTCSVDLLKPSGTLFRTYSFLDEAINQCKEFNCEFSGSTCVLVNVDCKSKKIISSNIGDSRAIMIDSSGSIFPLSLDHKPEEPEERERIEKAGGEVRKDYPQGPYRLYRKGTNSPGISLSKSFGDRVAHTIGMSSIPTVYEYEMESTLAIVLASDGVWQYLLNEEIRNIVLRYYASNDATGCINKIINLATEKWEENGEYRDDISVIVVFFEQN